MAYWRGYFSGRMAALSGMTGFVKKIYWRMRCSCNMQAIVNTGFMKMHKTA